MSELLLCPEISESPILLSHRDMMISLSVSLINIQRSESPTMIWVSLSLSVKKPYKLYGFKESKNIGTWMAWWSLWKERQKEQRGPLVQSKQYILHSLLCEYACNLHCTKNFSWSRGLSHGGQLLLFSSSAPCYQK